MLVVGESVFHTFANVASTSKTPGATPVWEAQASDVGE